MNDKEALLAYRMTQAEETLVDAQKMIENNFSFNRTNMELKLLKNSFCTPFSHFILISFLN